MFRNILFKIFQQKTICAINSLNLCFVTFPLPEEGTFQQPLKIHTEKHDQGHVHFSIHLTASYIRDGCLYIWLLLTFIFPFLMICFCSLLELCKSTVLHYTKVQFPSDQFEELCVSPRDSDRTNHNIEILPQG